MNLFKRHIGRRVTVVGVGVALLMLGLEAPAFAAAPAVTSFTPTSGPIDCVVVITGTAFMDSPAASTKVFFVPPAGGTGTEATAKAIISGTEIWAAVPGGLLTGTDYAIRVENLEGPGTASTTRFLITVGASACAPTITKLTPSCGSAGTTVKIEGTNLLQNDALLGIVGGDVFFNPYAAAQEGIRPVPDVDTATSLSRVVPAGAADGPVKLVTFASTGGTVFSSPFAVPPPDCVAALPFARGITLRLRDALVARGKVSASSATAPAGCTAAVPVKIQRRRAGGGWRTVGSTTTSDTGGYRKKIRNRHGKYRSLAPKLTLASGDVCSRAVSKVVRH